MILMIVLKRMMIPRARESRVSLRRPPDFPPLPRGHQEDAGLLGREEEEVRKPCRGCHLPHPPPCPLLAAAACAAAAAMQSALRVSWVCPALLPFASSTKTSDRRHAVQRRGGRIPTHGSSRHLRGARVAMNPRPSLSLRVAGEYSRPRAPILLIIMKLRNNASEKNNGKPGWGK